MTTLHYPLLIYLYALEVGDHPLAEALSRAIRRDRAVRRRSLASRTVAVVEAALGLSPNGG